MRKLRILLLALICGTVMLGCGVSAERLEKHGIYAEEFSNGALTANVENALLAGRTSFETKYLGKIKNLPALGDKGWQEGYICSRFVERLDAQYDQYKGYVSAKYSIIIKDGGLLEQITTENGRPKVFQLSYEAVDHCFMEMMQNSAEQAAYLFESEESLAEFDKRLCDLAERVQKTNYACEYLISSLSCEITDYGEITEALFTIEYNKNIPSLNEIPKVHDIRELYEAVQSYWRKDMTSKAYIMLDGLELSDKQLGDIISVAEVNCPLIPIECDTIWRTEYVRENGRQIIAVWLELPLGRPELQRLSSELQLEITSRGDSILSKYSDEYKLYQAIYREVISAAEYDDDIAEATKAGALSTDMRIGRTAYGALVDGKSVCVGYAGAYKALCDYAGLECYVILGKQDDGEHAWNMVRVNGEWKYVDCTFADAGGGSVYCLFDREKYGKWKYNEDDAFDIEDW